MTTLSVTDTPTGAEPVEMPAASSVACSDDGAQPCVLIVNAAAGALHPTAGGEEIQRMAREIGLELEVTPTSSPEETQAILRRCAETGGKRVVVAGGDGTVACAAQALAKTGVVLGILPQGTANNFASALHLPQDLPSALQVLKDGYVREVDLGRVGDRYFTESAGVGLFADMLHEYGESTNKNLFRAFMTLMKVGLAVRARRLRLTLDGQTFAECAVMCEVANSYRIGYAVPIAPEAKVADGLLNVVVVGDIGPRELWHYFKAFRSQLHRTLPEVSMARAREVRIESRRPMNVHADDTVIGTTPVTITIEPRALRVLVPRRDPGPAEAPA